MVRCGTLHVHVASRSHAFSAVRCGVARCRGVRYSLVCFGGSVKVQFKYGMGAVLVQCGYTAGAVRFVNFLLAPTVHVYAD